MANETETAGEALERIARELGLSMTAAFVPFSQSRNAKPGPFSRDGKPWRSLNWRVTISRNGRPILENIDYAQGEGHCPAYKADKDKWAGNSHIRERAIALECETGRRAKVRWIDGREPFASRDPIAAPSLADVLASLCLDAGALDYATYEEWAGDLGFDPDSRAGEAAYRACLATALALRAALGDAELQRLRDAANEY